MLPDDDLRDKTTIVWLKMIHRCALPISDALNAAELHGARPFLTLLYAHQLESFPRRTSTTLQPLKPDFDGLAPIHIQRLLVGYWSLAESWARFRHAMIPSTCPATCFLEKHTGLCQPLFKSSWERAVAQAERLPITATVNRIQMLLSPLRSLAPLISKTPGMDVPWDGAPCVYVPSNLPDDPFVKLMAGIPKSLEGHFFGKSFIYIFPYRVIADVIFSHLSF
jgi:hypothetical protein